MLSRFITRLGFITISVEEGITLVVLVVLVPHYSGGRCWSEPGKWASMRGNTWLVLKGWSGKVFKSVFLLEPCLGRSVQ